MMAFDIDAWWQKKKTHFQYYDPFLTYSNPTNNVFIKVDGEADRELNPATEALFGVGKEAFSRLARGQEISRSEFNDGYAAYFEFLDEMRSTMNKMNREGRLVGRSRNGDHVPIDFLTLEDTQVIPCCWEIFSKMPAPASVETRDVFMEIFLFHALRIL